MAVVLTLALAGAIALFLLRRCRRNTRGGQSVPLVGDGTARKSGLDTDKPVQTPIYGQNGDINPHVRPDELPAISNPQELPANEREKSRIARVDGRAAAGYDGAYRSNWFLSWWYISLSTRARFDLEFTGFRI